jgi:lysophospholipase L1-like esterase
MKTVLCYGDSNTWGAVPASTARHEPSQRWPNVLQQALGGDWQVVSEGLPGRTTVHDDPVEGGHLSGFAYLRPCLESHRPLDLVILMLGTNDFKRRFGLEAEDIAQGVKRLVMEAARLDVYGGKQPRIFVVCPPAVDVLGAAATMFEGADRKSRQLAPLVAEVARACGAGFLDAGAVVRSSPIDGFHLDPDAQVALGQAIARPLLEFLERNGRSPPGRAREIHSRPRKATRFTEPD